MKLPLTTATSAVESFYDVANRWLRDQVPGVPYGEVGIMVTIHDHQIVSVKKILEEKCRLTKRSHNAPA